MMRSCVKRYLERRNTRYEHQAEIAEVYGYRDFSAAEAGFRRWLDDQAWTTGDGPKALFYAAAAWLRQQRVLLPGVSTLAEVVASVRHAAQQRLYTMLAADPGLRDRHADLVTRMAEARIRRSPAQEPTQPYPPEFRRVLRQPRSAALGSQLHGTGSAV
jgi:hypothetical protein